ncbi:hypothetical protein NHX12_013605, partial [Muraenolepis orangiensis]
VLGFGKGDGVESKLVTVVHGNDLANVSFLNFQAMQEDVAKIWTEELFKMHRGTPSFAKLKNILKMFSDKRRVEMALEQCGLATNKTEGIKGDDFTWESFQKFLDSLSLRPEIQSIFEDSGSKRKPFISLDQLMDFINQQQRDSRLNEVLYPPLKREQIRQIMEKYESNAGQLERDQISLLGFTRYLGGEENTIVPPERLDLIDDMNQPLAHYFINSSHNTYLAMGQLTGPSSVEMYRQVLLTGCRCIELDCWKGRPQDEEPYITHGFTMTTEIPFKEVIEAIAESAFKTSSYPLILSFENHVDSAKQQAKMLLPGQALPTPQELMGKILIKNKKKHHHPHRPSSGGSIRRRELEGQSPPNHDCPLMDSDGAQLLSNGEENPLLKKPNSDERRRSMDTLKSAPIEFVEYNKNQLSRIYPKGTRVDSSNYMPQLFWNVGCQMVALNFQTLARVHEENRQVISGQFLTDKKVGVYVEVDIFGLPADTKRKYRTRTSNGNSLDPVWDDETFVFSKNELNQPLLLPSLLVYTEAQDYIPNEHQEYAEALTNPIKHVSLLDQRESQLAVLLEDHIELEPAPGGPLPSPIISIPGGGADEPIDPINSPGPGQKDLITTVLAEMQVQPLEELKQQKNYVKLLKKQCKDLKEIIKKHEPQEPAQRQLYSLEQEVQQQTVQLREWQMKGLLELRKEQHTLERERKHIHLQEAFQKLKETAHECQATQFKKLREACEKEKKELQRILDRKRLNSITEAKGRDKEKAETLDKLVLRQREILQHIDEEQPMLRSRLESDLEAEVERLPDEIRQFLQAELQSKGLRSDALFSTLTNNGSPSSGGSAHSSTCSTPTFPPSTPPSGSTTWHQSLDRSATSLADSISECASHCASDAGTSLS